MKENRLIYSLIFFNNKKIETYKFLLISMFVDTSVHYVVHPS
jgi:hypothetical protein